jgi:hypothetical protein
MTTLYADRAKETVRVIGPKQETQMVDLHPLYSRAAELLRIEPTWFGESGSGLALFGWSAACFFTPDFTIHGAAWALPCIGVVFGPFRWLFLRPVVLQAAFGPRMICATFSALVWAWIALSMGGVYGINPSMFMALGFCFIDLLTMARFSIPCARDLVVEMRGRHE